MQIKEKPYKWASALTKRKLTELIILHHAEASTCTADDIHKWHLANGWAGFGYHFLVRKDGTVYRGRPEDTIGAHAYGANTNSVGICFEGNYEKETMPTAQKKAGAELVSYLMKKYPDAKVAKHKDFGATNCPGKNFPFADISRGIVEQEKTATITIRELHENHRGGDVKALQAILNTLGCSCGSVDGIMGAKTVKALKSYQQKKGLSADGICGEKTWKKLLKA